MKLTDKTAIKILRRAKSSDLEDHIRSYPEDEIDGKTDIEILRDEIEYLVDMYEEDGTIYSGDLQEAREILRDTNNGKTNRFTQDFDLMYTDWDIKRSRNTVNEYKRLKRLLKEV